MKKIYTLIYIALFNQACFSQDLAGIQSCLDSIEYCAELKENVDKFDGTITTSSPLLKDISFSRVAKGKSVIIYMSVTLKSTSVYSGRGLTILLDKSQKIIKPDLQIETVVSEGYFEHRAFFQLTKSDIGKLLKHEIIDAKLYIYEMGEISSADKTRYRTYLSCLSKL